MPQSTPATSDPFHLQRFLEAQSSTYQQARSELTAGEKCSHWMWFIFPQIHGLGSSSMAQRYAITGLTEAAAYLAHPILGPRLRGCTSLVNAVEKRSIGAIFGYPDDLKFHSSITLFAEAATHAGAAPNAENDVFAKALAKYFGGKPDQHTLSILAVNR